MKIYLTAFTLFLLTISTYGQIGLTFNNAKNQGIDIKSLDSIYMNAINYADSTKGAFININEFYDNYLNMLKEFGRFLNENDFKWEKTTKGFNRIYFNTDGSVDYFLYNFKEGEISEEKELRFNQLLNEFIKNYKFPMTNEHKFVQCSPVNYLDK